MKITFIIRFLRLHENVPALGLKKKKKKIIRRPLQMISRLDFDCLHYDLLVRV